MWNLMTTPVKQTHVMPQFSQESELPPNFLFEEQGQEQGQDQGYMFEQDQVQRSVQRSVSQYSQYNIIGEDFRQDGQLNGGYEQELSDHSSTIRMQVQERRGFRGLFRKQSR
eukprot:TRINITY_DN51070_c1_g2_i1.p5 TRINITY_DN51070_c1_g2~~TRINITY_DN51070_c1_g2_i1.p5  ORF type:complete len:112 (-),score=18.35 TRINITY_DN51070_c1_g2_i1:415-750(-)